MKTTNTAPEGARRGFCQKFAAMLLSALLITTLTGPLFAQAPAPALPQFTVEQLQQDFTALRDSLEKLHAGLYRYHTKQEMDRILDRSYQEINRPMTVMAYFKYIDHLIGEIDDGHTECFPPAEANQWIKTNAGLFPMGLWLSDGHAYVLCNTRDFSAGTEILSVNGRSIKKITRDMLGELSSDGANITGKYDKINRGHDPFPYLYFVLYGSQENFSINYEAPDGTFATKKIPAGKFTEVECLPNTSQPAKYLSLEYKPGGVALLTIRTFLDEYLDRTGEKFRDFLFSSFKEIGEKHVNKLIIDVRGNGGGEDENGALLYSYIADKPFSYYERIDKTTGPLTNHPDLATLQPSPEHFDGKVIILINGGSFSATADFAAIAKSNSRGVFIGEETGGGYYGNTSGSRTTIYPPNTRIRVNIPLNRYTNAVRPLKGVGRGIVPDVEVEPTIDDKLTGRDGAMEIALQMAEKTR